MAEPRKCKVMFSYEEISGMFIQYGSAVVYDDGGRALQKTTAIVEADDGKVYEVDPSKIKFVK